MKIHEYQAHEIFKQYDIPTAESRLAYTPEQARQAAEAIGCPVVVKAQVLVGGRGKAGGVKVAGTVEEAYKHAGEILGLTIKSIPVEKVLIAKAVRLEREYYVGLTIDRNNKSITLMASKSGGVDIEELAVSAPGQILKLQIFPLQGIDKDRLDEMLNEIFERPELIMQARDLIEKLYKIFSEKGCSLVEINPYALIDGNRLIALDAKINFDDNALPILPEIEQLRNAEEYSPDEIRAREVGLSFVSMDGNIGCIVNGAGLAMATMDLIKHFGGNPANFLDVGGSSNPQKVLDALTIILNNKNVTAILINIFGGITRCDDIANGIIMAKEKIEIPVPVVIRLIGTNDREGRQILTNAGLSAMENLTDAVVKVVGLGKQG